MLHHIEIHREEPRLQRGAECVALHQADLGVGRLVAQQVLLRGDHVLKDLEKAGGGILIRRSLIFTFHSSQTENRDVKSLLQRPKLH